MRIRGLPRRLRHGEEATLVEHLGELRARLLLAGCAVLLGFVVAFAFHGHLIDWLREPLPADRRKLVTFGVTEPFFTAVKVSFYAGLALALPVVLWQLWAFLAPAVSETYQRVVAAFVALGTLLFAGGLAFGYWIALPRALTFLTNYDENLYQVQIRASYYYSFATLTLLAMGLVFELPIFMLALVRLGILTSAKLRRNRRTGYVAVVALAVLLPTIDPISLIFESIPLLLLFEGSIWLSVFFERRWQARELVPRSAP